MRKMRVRLVLVGALACTSVIVGAPMASADCGSTIQKQTEKGVEAGGGPKAGIPAPTNCDHFFQEIGVIGNGNPKADDDD